MSDFTNELRSFEDAYNDSVNGSPEVAKAIHLRNVGWDAFRAGDRIPGIVNLTQSSIILEGQPDDFAREQYATKARLAQALCANGEFGNATQYAHEALEITPQGFKKVVSRRLEDFGPVGSPGRTNAEFDVERPLSSLAKLEDQYRVIFAGRISLILGASGEENSLFAARDLAVEARALARISEDPNKVAFTNREMSDEERDSTRSKFGRVAWTASAGIWLPLTVPRIISKASPVPLSRRELAQLVCSR